MALLHTAHEGGLWVMAEGWSVPGYADIRELGRGACGRVVLAERQETGTAVAIKHLADELRRDPAFVAGFRAEAEVLATLGGQGRFDARATLLVLAPSSTSGAVGALT
jgi:serine/threonine protein kinase